MINNRIRELRESSDKTLQQIADEVGSTTTTIQRMETGEVNYFTASLNPSLGQLVSDGWIS